MIGIALAFLGAALSVVLPGFGSAIGVGKTGQAGAGVISEEPEKFGKVLLLQALPSTQGIYGFIGAFWIIIKLRLLTGEIPPISWETGLAILFGAFPVALTGFVSALYQAGVSISSMNVVVKQPQDSGKSIIMAAMVETYAVLGLLATILLIQGIKI